MFFPLSKIFWFFADPGNLLFVGLALAAVLAWTPGRRASRWFLTLSFLFALVAGFLPLGQIMWSTLENRIPPPVRLPERVDGIIVLGGVVDQFVTQARGQLSVGGAVERILAAARLAKVYPDARIVYSGGSGRLLRQDLKEADYVAPLFEELGVDPGRLVIESRSRNTAENAVFTKRLVDPAPGETWILITSAFHMPRALGAFRKAGWSPVPYPVDYATTGTATAKPGASLLNGLGRLSAASHEWIGLVFYWLTGRTDALFPSADGGGQENGSNSLRPGVLTRDG